MERLNAPEVTHQLGGRHEYLMHMPAVDSSNDYYSGDALFDALFEILLVLIRLGENGLSFILFLFET